MVSISNCHMMRHRDGGGGVFSISNCHMIRHRDGVCVCVCVGGGVFCLRLSHD